jgi:hypothetical protein
MTDQQRNLIKKRKLASRKALAKATDHREYEEAMATMKKMNYDPVTSKIAVAAIKSKYLPKYMASLANVDEDAEMRELANEYDIVDANEEETDVSDEEEELSEDTEELDEDSEELEEDEDELEEDEDELEENEDEIVEYKIEPEEDEDELVEDNVELEQDVDPVEVEEMKEDAEEFDQDADFNDEVTELELTDGQNEIKIHTPSDEVIRIILESFVNDEPVNTDEKIVPSDSEITEKGVFKMEQKASTRAQRKVAAVEDVKPKNRNLGEDTAYSGDGRGKPTKKPFKMEQGLNVAGPNQEGKTMRLQGDGSNPLYVDPEVDFFAVPTNMPDHIWNDKARKVMKLEGEHGDLVKQKVDGAVQNIPTEGGADFMEFELPTQLDYTKIRNPKVAQLLDDYVEENDLEDDELDEPILDEDLEDDELNEPILDEDLENDELDEPILDEDLENDELLDDEGLESFSGTRKRLIASKVGPKLYKENYNEKQVAKKIASRTCDAYEGNTDLVELVDCNTCGARLVLSQKAQADGYCPSCAAIDEKAKELVAQQKKAELNKADYGDEFAEDKRGEDINGDGGFRTKQNVNVTENEESEGFATTAEIDYLRKALAEEKVRSARLAASTKAAVRMAERSIINETDIENKIDEFMGSGMTVPAIQNFERTMLQIASKKQVSSSTVKTTKQAGVSGLTSIPVMAEDRNPVDLTHTLRNLFVGGMPSDKDFDEKTGRRIR